LYTYSDTLDISHNESVPESIKDKFKECFPNTIPKYLGIIQGDTSFYCIWLLDDVDDQSSFSSAITIIDDDNTSNASTKNSCCDSSSIISNSDLYEYFYDNNDCIRIGEGHNMKGTLGDFVYGIEIDKIPTGENFGDIEDWAEEISKKLTTTYYKQELQDLKDILKELHEINPGIELSETPFLFRCCSNILLLLYIVFFLVYYLNILDLHLGRISCF
jgi:hypothetical protein